MLSVQDRENIMGWAYVWLKDAAWTNTRATYCDVEPVCCDDIAKIWFLICLINRSVGVIDDSDIELLYQRLQCLIGLSTVTTCPENCFPCQDPNPPTPTPTGCTLQVGSGCCDYSVEGIELRPRICFTVQDITPLEPSGGSWSIMLEYNTDVYPLVINESADLSYTQQEIIDIINSTWSENEFFEISINGFDVCVFINENINFLFNIDYDNATTLPAFPYDSWNVNSYGLDIDSLVNSEVTFTVFYLGINNLSFQVLINDTWTDVTDEVTNGTWSRTNVCDDVITEWRIIDSEENVVDSGEVTATCEGSTEVTDSVCNWLQAHQTAIEQLQAGGGGSGLTCETVGDCEVIQTIQQDVVTAQETADDALQVANAAYPDSNPDNFIDQAGARNALSFVSGSGGYNAGTGVISIPTNNNELTNGAGYITSAALNPLAFFSGTAAHTGNTDETIVQTLSVASSAWATNAVYQILARVTRAAGTVTFRVRMNTTPDLTGSPITILEFGTTTAGNNPNRLLIKTGNSFEYSTLTTITDLSVVSTTATATMSTAGTIYIMLTIQGSAGTANGAFTMLNIARQ